MLTWIWIILPLVLFTIVSIENSSADEISVNEDCVNKENIEDDSTCTEEFRPQSMKVFSVVDSAVGIFEDPETKLTIVDLGSFYGIGGNGTVPDKIEIFRNNSLWKTLEKETGIAPSTSHSEWQIPQTVFFNELPGKYRLVLTTDNTETLVFEFFVKQITERYEQTGSNTYMEKNLRESEFRNNNYLAPLKQVENGISPLDVRCKEGMDLVFKKTNGNPVCVNPDTIEKLIERNWLDVTLYDNMK